MGLLRDKRGAEGSEEEESVLMPAIIFIILTLLFISMTIFFIYTSSSNARVYEQIYSKQIALLIDQAKPGTNISVDLSKAYELAGKNKKFKNLVSIDTENNEVEVALTLRGEGYAFKYFNSAKIKPNEVRYDKKLYIEVT